MELEILLVFLVPLVPSGIVTAVGPMTAQEFRQGVKRDKAHYETLKKDEGFHDWNCGFVATARMHHTHLL
jgi:hypothetical protein